MVFARAALGIGRVGLDDDVRLRHVAERPRHCRPGRGERVLRVFQHRILGIERELRVGVHAAQEILDRAAAEVLIDELLHLAMDLRDLLKTQFVDLLGRRMDGCERTHERRITFRAIGVRGQRDVLARLRQVLVFDEGRETLDCRCDLAVEEVLHLLGERRIVGAAAHVEERVVGLQQRADLLGDGLDRDARRAVAEFEAVAQVRDLRIDVPGDGAETRQRLLPEVGRVQRLHVEHERQGRVPGRRRARLPEFVVANARRNRTLELLVHHAVADPVAAADVSGFADRVEFGEPGVFAVFPGAECLRRVVEQAVVACARDGVVGPHRRVALEVRREEIVRDGFDAALRRRLRRRLRCGFG